MIFFNEAVVLGMIALSILYWLVIPKSWRLFTITFASFAVLATIQPLFTALLYFIILAVYFNARFIIEKQNKGRRLLGGVLFLTLILLFSKYAGWLFRDIFQFENDFAKNYLVPLGVSYLCFKLIAFIIDVYRGVIEKPKLADLLAFIFFLPTFPAGPIERYQNFTQKRIDDFSMPFYVEGLKRLALGYFKKVVIVNYFFNEWLIKGLQTEILADGVSLDLAGWKVLLYLVGALFYAYVDLSAYADIAIGFGRLFGFKIIENMRWPIFQRNLSDYWSRWHISLSGWCRNNVYFPVLGQTRNMALGLYASFIVMGLWHNISLNWLLWGIWHATGVYVYSAFARKMKKMKKRYKRAHGKPMPRLPEPISYGLGMCATCLYAGGGYAFVMTDATAETTKAAMTAFRILAAIFV